MAIPQVLLRCLLITCFSAFGSVTGQNLFADDVGIEGQPMVMTCDLRRSGYTGNLAEVDGVHSLTVSKSENNQDEVLVNYYVPPPTGTSDNTVVNNLPASSYEVLTEGLYPATDGNIEGNQNGMKIVIRFLTLSCANQGIYKCKASYYVGSQLFTLERSENLTIDAMPRWKTNNLDNPLNAKPFEQNCGYKENANVTFRCRASGPSNMVIRWRYQLCVDPNRNPALGSQTPIIENWFPSSDIRREETGSGSSDSCRWLELESRLGDDVDGARIQLNKVGRSADGLLCFLQCQVGYMERNVFQELSQRNATFQYEEPPSTAPEVTALSSEKDHGTNLVQGDDVIVTCRVSGGTPLVQSMNLTCGDLTETGTRDNSVDGDAVVLSLIIPNISARYNLTDCVCQATHITGCYDMTGSVRLTALGVLETYQAQPAECTCQSQFTGADVAYAAVFSILGTLGLGAAIASIIYFVKRGKRQQMKRGSGTEYDTVAETSTRYQNVTPRDPNYLTLDLPEQEKSELEMTPRACENVNLQEPHYQIWEGSERESTPTNGSATNPRPVEDSHGYTYIE